MQQPVLTRDFKLDPDQEQWLYKYRSIDLHKWRLEIINHDPANRIRTFLYVGESQDDPDRYQKLQQNRYCFWPEPPK